jgi:hypothetical protein
MPGNFICKKCTLCNHMVGMAAAVAEAQWPQVLANIKASCQHNKSEEPNKTTDAAVLAATAPQPPQPEITGKTFGAVAANVSANLAGIPPAPAYPPPAYTDPTLQNIQNPFELPQDDTGPGAQLKKFLSRIGITATPTCSCNAKARHMDAMGVDWCEQNVDLIVSWLKEEAHKRGLPFIDLAGRVLVNRAIAASRKAHAHKLKRLNIPNGLQ